MPKKQIPPTAMHGFEGRTGAPINLSHEGFLFSSRLFILGHVLKAKPDRVIDIGCGEGNLLRDMRAQRDSRAYTGVDIRPQPAVAGWDVEFVQCDVTREWPIESESADCVVLGELLEHLPEHQSKRVLRRAMESICPSGWLVITTPAARPKVNWEEELRKFGHVFYWTEARLRKRLEKAGFEVESFASRFLGNRCSWAQCGKAIRQNFGAEAWDFCQALEQRYHQRIVKALIHHLVDGAAADHINIRARRRQNA
jgi:SAM-dependent methyltransferase